MQKVLQHLMETRKGRLGSGQDQMFLSEATDGLLQTHLPPVDGQHRRTVPAGWIGTFHAAETELLQEQQTPAQPWHSWPMKADGSNQRSWNPHSGSHQLFIGCSITMVTTLPLSSILNWKMWILVPVLPASNMMQYWWLGGPDGGFWCWGGIQPARPSWRGRWASSLAASSLAASRWRLTKVRYVSRNPRRRKTAATFGTFITTHSVLSFPADKCKLAHSAFQHFTP